MVFHYSTDDLGSGSRISRWNDIVAEVFTPLETKAKRPDEFHGAVDSVQLGDIYLSNVRASPATIIRSSENAANCRERRYFIHMQLKGDLLASQDGREAHLRPGDLVICDSALPYSLQYEEPSSTLVVAARPNEIKGRLPAPEAMLGRRLDSSLGLPATLSALLNGVWREAQEGLNEEIAQRLGRNLLDIFATTCMDVCGDRVAVSAVGSARRSHIRCYIESHLREPDLSVSSIAKAFRISPRYLHMLFAEEDETISGYIRRRRLEECRKRLADPMWMRRSITELAYAWGFNNTTHFARVFREHYGVSPRDYRNANQPQESETVH